MCATARLFLSLMKIISCQFPETLSHGVNHMVQGIWGRRAGQVRRAHLQTAAEQDVQLSFIFSEQGLLLQ